MKELNPVARKWVKALRSGKYKQGRYSLMTYDGEYCCLGVLTDLAVKAGIIKKFIGKNGGNECLCRTVQKWAKLADDEGFYTPKTGPARYNHLSNDNDSGKSFEKISDIIESNQDSLFI